MLLLLPSILVAAPIDPTIAQQVANNFINAPHVDANGIMRAPAKPKRMVYSQFKNTDENLFYVFNSDCGEGFVIVAADNKVIPILGFSNSGSFNYDNLSEATKCWLDGYARQIKYAIENDIIPSSSTVEEWKKLKENSYSSSEVVSPLITTKWNQAPYYNVLCPYNGITQSFTLTGCAATALAQVMNFWEWPIIGNGYYSYNTFWYGKQSANFGSTYYDWSNMPDSVVATSTTSEMYAVATLMYHCGVAMDMDYGYDVSGIKSASQVADAVKKYFRYSAETKVVEKNNYTNQSWVALLKSQLDAKQPIVYCGIGTGGGHAFVCDGYRSDDYFHFNWGWGGVADGWYPVTDLAPGPNGYGSGSTGDYTRTQSAVIDMCPITTSTSAIDLQLSSKWSISRDSIPYGGTLTSSVTIKNMGTSNFTGDIVAMVLDKEGNFFADYTIKENCTITKNGSLTLNPSVSGNAALLPGQYYVSLFFKNNEMGYQIIGSNYFDNVVSFKVYHHAEIETYSKISIYSEDNNNLVQGHNAQISLTLKNTGTTYFSGQVALVLYTGDLSSGQDFDEIDMSIAGISAGSKRTVTFSGTINLTPGTYVLAAVYRDNNGNLNFVGSTYFENPIYVIIKGEGEGSAPSDEFRLVPGKYVIVANREKDDKNNWYYMTADLGTAGTKRFQAVLAGTENIDAIATNNLEDKYVWELEADGSNWKLKNGGQYVTWKSGNSANLDATGKSLTFDVADNQVVAHFNDGSAERYLSLNVGNDYFAFYANTGQIEQLYFLPCEAGQQPPIEEPKEEFVVLAQRNTNSNWFYMTADLGTAGTKRFQAIDAGTPNKALINTSPTDTKYIWSFEEVDGGVALVNGEQYASWKSGNSAILSTTPMALNITDVSEDQVNMSFVDGEGYTRYLSLNATAGNNYFAFYKGTTQKCNLLIIPYGEKITTDIDVILPETPIIHKVIRDGQLLIIRDGKTYNAQGILINY